MPRRSWKTVQNPCDNAENETDHTLKISNFGVPGGPRDIVLGASRGVPGGPRDICPRGAPGRPGTHQDNLSRGGPGTTRTRGDPGQGRGAIKPLNLLPKPHEEGPVLRLFPLLLERLRLRGLAVTVCFWRGANFRGCLALASQLLRFELTRKFGQKTSANSYAGNGRLHFGALRVILNPKGACHRRLLALNFAQLLRFELKPQQSPMPAAAGCILGLCGEPKKKVKGERKEGPEAGAWLERGGAGRAGGAAGPAEPGGPGQSGGAGLLGGPARSGRSGGSWRLWKAWVGGPEGLGESMWRLEGLQRLECLEGLVGGGHRRGGCRGGEGWGLAGAV